MNEILKKAKELVELLEKQEKSGKIKLSELNPGDVFQTTGKRKYKVLEQYENTTKIVSFNLVKENVKFGDNADYLESELKELCDTEILANFEEEFGAENIETHEADLITVDGQNTGVSVKCKIRPLTFDEARKYTELTPNKNLMTGIGHVHLGQQKNADGIALPLFPPRVTSTTMSASGSTVFAQFVS